MGEGKRGLGIPCKATPYVTHSRTHLPAPDAAHIAAGSSYLLLLPCALASGSWAMISLLADFAAEIAGPDLWRDILKEGVSVCCDIAVPPGMLSLPLPFRPLTPPPDLPASPAAASLRGRLRSICERQRAGGCGSVQEQVQPLRGRKASWSRRVGPGGACCGGSA